MLVTKTKMNPLTLPLSEIQITNRQRLDLGDISSLAESLRVYGLIQPIVIDQNKRLIAGGRRCAAASSLGWTDILVVYRETLTEDELHILELEENIQRKDETWQEKALHIHTIHQIKQRTKALDAEIWGQRETGAMLGISSTHINYCLTIAKLLRSELDSANKPIQGARFWSCDSLSAAWKLWLRDKQDKLLAELAARAQVATESTASETPEVSQLIEKFNTETLGTLASDIPVDQQAHILSLRQRAGGLGYLELTETEARTLYLSNPINPPEEFEEYYQEKRAYLSQRKDTIHLSNRLVNIDCIKYMFDPSNKERFDHIITDIPYAIDMDNLNQQNPLGGMKDIDTVEALHDVDYNLKLIADFFPAAFHCTKPNSFVITWCDQMLWQYMYDHAIKAGFAVQRWPITWVKTSSCMNQCAQFNTTKDTEIAIVCRKKGSTLAKQPQTSVITASRDDMCKSLGHPFAKPFEVWQFLINLVSIEGQTILEPFSGRGSGVLSMLRLKRNVIGLELDVAHYNALLENVKTLYYLPLNPNFQFT